MHPQYTSDRPGAAPCCGMRLEPVYSDGSAASGQPAAQGSSLPAGAVHISPEHQQLIGVRTSEVEMRPAAHTIRSAGRIATDETRIFRVNATVDGWIREISPPTTGSLVAKDEQLAAFYSPEFLAAQQAYLYALGAMDRFQASGKETPQQIALTKANIQQAKDSLHTLGMGESQVAELAHTRQLTQSIRITAPAASFVLARNVTAGQRFQRGEELYRLADLSRIWVLADLFERDSQHVRPGQMVKVLYQGRTFHAQVSEVPPQFDSDSRTLRARLEMDNPANVLRPGMFVDVEFPVSLPPAVNIPADALIDSGLRKTVFVDRGNGYFEPRLIETGWRFGDRVQVTRGLQPGERIVVAGNFLLDSESRMKTAAAGIQAPAKDPVCGMDVDRVKAKAAGRTSQHQGATYYFCSDQCKRQFDQDPAQFTGGAPGQSKEAQGPAIDPVCGMEVDRAEAKAGGRTSRYRGTTYFFCADHCKKQFDKEPAKYLKKPAGSGHSSGSGGVHI